MKFQPKAVKERSGDDKGGEVFLKIQDGETVNVVFRGEIFEFYGKWVNGKFVEMPQSDPTQMNRFKVNAVVYDMTQKTFVSKIWEFPTTVYNDLANINVHYPVEKTKIAITRKGVKTDTTYTLIPLPGPIQDQAMKAIEKVPLKILNKSQVSANPEKKPDGYDDFGPPPEDDHSEIPF